MQVDYRRTNELGIRNFHRPIAHRNIARQRKDAKTRKGASHFLTRSSQDHGQRYRRQRQDQRKVSESATENSASGGVERFETVILRRARPEEGSEGRQPPSWWPIHPDPSSLRSSG